MGGGVGGGGGASAFRKLEHQSVSILNMKPDTHLPVMPQEFPGFAVDVAQIDAARHAGRVQVTQVGHVCRVFRDFLQNRAR